MQKRLRSSSEFSARRVRVAPGLCMVDIAVVSDGQRKARLAGSETVIVLLSVSIWKCNFVEQADGINDRPLDGKAEAVNNWHLRILRRVKYRESGRKAVKKR